MAKAVYMVMRKCGTTDTPPSSPLRDESKAERLAVARRKRDEAYQRYSEAYQALADAERAQTEAEKELQRIEAEP